MAGRTRRDDDNGYPYYSRDGSPTKRPFHPMYEQAMEQLNQMSLIKYATYRLAHKIEKLQEHLRVPGVKLITGVFARHRLSTSESSLTLEPCELEAVLTDIYFAAEKEGSYQGNIDIASEVALSFLLSVYDSQRTSHVSIRSAMTALVVLCDSPNRLKWRALFSTVADHNGCVSPRRLSSLLVQISMIAEHLGERSHFGLHLIQAEVDKCFAKTPGMLGLSEYGLLQWIEGESPSFLAWMDVRTRLHESALNALKEDGNSSVVRWKCSVCDEKNPKGLKFKCSKCWGMMICERCYLYSDTKVVPSSNLYKHKKSHTIKEIIDVQGVPSQRIVSLVKNVKKALTFPSNCRRGHDISMEVQFPLEDPVSPGTDDRQSTSHEINEAVKRKEHKMFTSTVGRANGKNISDPKIILHDIILKLENQNRALQSLSSLLNDLQNGNSADRRIQQRVDSHFNQIATQINRLKLLQSNLPGVRNQLSNWEQEAPIENPLSNTIVDSDSKIPKFEAFSPIPVMPKDCINESTVMEHKNINIGRRTGENFKYKNADSISHVSMSDISLWYGNDIDISQAQTRDKLNSNSDEFTRRRLATKESSVAEDKFNADIESVATSNNKMRELNADLDSVLDRLQTILTNNFALDDINFDNTQLQETANEMEGLLGSLIRGVEQRRTKKGDRI